MYGVQLDQLRHVLGVTEPAGRAIARAGGGSGTRSRPGSGPGGPWVWLTRAGLAACGLPYRAARPRCPGWRTCAR